MALQPVVVAGTGAGSHAEVAHARGNGADGRLRQELAALGPILVLWPDGIDRALAESTLPSIVERAAARQLLRARVGVRSDATIEELVACDAVGARVRLVRLPDSDYFGWERWCRRVPRVLEEDPAAVWPAYEGAALARCASPVERWCGAAARFACARDRLELIWLRRCSVAALRVMDALRRGDELRIGA
jgi:hypothetical protein